MKSQPLPKSDVMVLQSVAGHQITFNIVRAAQEIHNAIASAPYWERDLRAVVALCMVISTLPGLGFSAYCSAGVDDSTWPVFSLQLCLLVLSALWVFVSYYRNARALTAMLYLTLVSVVVAGVLLGLWVSLFRSVSRRVEWLWWTLLAVLSAQTLLLVAAANALGSLMSCRMTYDAHMYLLQAVNTHTNEQLDRQAALSSTAGATTLPQEQLGSDAVFLQQMAPHALRRAAASTQAPSSSTSDGVTANGDDSSSKKSS